MAQHYSNPSRENDPHSLPNIETFFHQHAKRELCALNAGHKAELYGECITDDDGDCLGTGWYWHACFPGCLPDGDPSGPFETEQDAIADAREGYDDSDDDSDANLPQFLLTRENGDVLMLEAADSGRLWNGHAVPVLSEAQAAIVRAFIGDPHVSAIDASGLCWERAEDRMHQCSNCGAVMLAWQADGHVCAS